MSLEKMFRTHLIKRRRAEKRAKREREKAALARKAIKTVAIVTFPPSPLYRKLPACSQECAGCQEGHHCGGKLCDCDY